jgi:hypothetical protein
MANEMTKSFEKTNDVWFPERFISQLDTLRRVHTQQIVLNVQTLETLEQSGRLSFDARDTLEFWKSELACREVAARIARDRAAFEMGRKERLS